MDKIKPDEKVCYNCKYLAWLIGVGQGLRCSHPLKEPKNQLVPSRTHTCELFENNTSKKEDK
jgi:hypothetical protein